MRRKKQFLTALDALSLKMSSDILDDLRYMAHAALEEEYKKGVVDGKHIIES